MRRPAMFVPPMGQVGSGEKEPPGNHENGKYRNQRESPCDQNGRKTSFLSNSVDQQQSPEYLDRKTTNLGVRSSNLFGRASKSLQYHPFSRRSLALLP